MRIQGMIAGFLALGVALVGSAYAEVQNIKVSGDIDLKGITHVNYDLKEKQRNFSHEGTGGADNVSNDDNESFLLSTVRLQVDADLTDNVSATVRLLNQRKWDNQVGGGDDQITVDNAYVVLREFFYSPLTVIAGRQNLSYGTQFVVGDGRLADPEGVFPSTATTGTQLTGREYSAFNSFDAIRLILDFAPLTVEGLIAKNNETGVLSDDENLYGVVVNYKLDQWNAEVEPYWFFLDDESGARTVTVNDSVLSSNAARAYEINRVHTVGLRLAGSPIENLQLVGEGAYQFGELIDTGPAGALVDYQERDRSAWGANVYANYTWAQVPWSPATGVGWVFFSGEEPSAERGTSGAGVNNESDKFNAWDSIYRGSFTTYIQDFLGGQDAPANLYTTLDRNDTNASTNRHHLYGDVSASPMEDVTLFARYIHSWFDEAPRPGRDKEVGSELDVKAVYDYTEDVQLAAFGGWFFPGDYYDGERDSSLRSNDLAWTAGGAASVKF